MKHVSSLNRNNIDKNKRYPWKQIDLEFFIGRQDCSENKRVVVEVVLLVKHFTRIKTSASTELQRDDFLSWLGADSIGCAPGAIQTRKKGGRLAAPDD